jgi:serine/threonine protein phosphatase PrpC
LWTVVARDTLREVLAAAGSPREAVDRLVEAARAAGAPDNLACAAYFSAA